MNNSKKMTSKFGSIGKMVVGKSSERHLPVSTDKESDEAYDPSNWLPDGWTTEEITPNSVPHRGAEYKVYIEVSSGKRFYSRASVTQYLGTKDLTNTVTDQNKSDNAVEQSPHMSPQCLSTTNTGGIPEEENKDNSIKLVDKPSPKCIDMTNTGGTVEEIKKNSSVKMLDKVDDPSPHLSMKKTGAISGEKEKGTSFKSVAVESFAADDLPPDWTKEIVTSKCGIATRKDPSPSPPHEKLAEHNAQLFVGAESKGCSVNIESDAKISNQTISNNDSDIVTVTENNPEPKNGASKDEPVVTTDVDAAISSPLITEKTPAKTENPRKRITPSVPSCTSERLPGIEPEIQPDSILSEHSLRASAKTKIDPLNEVDVAEPPKEALSENAFVEKGTPKGIEEQPKEVSDENPLIIPEEQTFNNNDDENKQESSQLCVNFGDTLSVPSESALKTLRGEIPIDDTLDSFPGCDNENLTIPFNNNSITLDGCAILSQSDMDDVFRKELDGSFADMGNFGFMYCTEYNNDSSTDAGKNE